jgi:hypothetical protein
MDREQAKKLVLELYKSSDPDDERVITKRGIIEKKWGWVFFVTSQKYLDTGDPSNCLPIGAGPVVVEKDGTMTPLGISRPSKEEIRVFEERRGYVKPKSHTRKMIEAYSRRFRRTIVARATYFQTRTRNKRARQAAQKRTLVEVSILGDTLCIDSRDQDTVHRIVKILTQKNPYLQVNDKSRESIVGFQLTNLEGNGIEFLEGIIAQLMVEGWKCIDCTGFPNDDGRVYICSKHID